MTAHIAFLGSIAVSVLWTCLYVAASIQAGGFLLKWIRGESDRPKSLLEDLNLSFLLGLAIFSVLITIIGLFGILNRFVLISLLALSAVVFAIRLFLRSTKLPAIFASMKSSQLWALSPGWLLFALVLACIVGLYGLFSLVQPVSGDAEAFYMTLPKVIAYSERLVPLRNYYNFSSISWFGELHFAALLSVSGLMSAKFLVWFLYLSMAASIHSFGLRMGHGLKSRIVSQALLLTSSTVTMYIASGKVDLFAAALGLGAFLIILEPDTLMSLRPCILAGILIGFSAVAKMSYIPVLYIGLFFALVAPPILQRRGIAPVDLKILLIRGGTIAAISAIAFVPHLMKNSSLFGEPFAPFIYLHARPDVGVSLQQAWFSPEATRYIVLTYPLQLFFGRFPLQEGTLSPLVLALLPMGIAHLYRNRGKGAIALTMLIVAGVSVLVWVLMRPSWLAPRYILAPLLLLIPIAGGSLGLLSGGSPKKGVALFLLIFLVAGLLVSAAETRLLPSMRKTASALLRGKAMAGSSQEGVTFLNENVPEGSRVFIAGWYTYYMRPDILSCMNGDKQMTPITTRADFLQYLRRGDFKFIYVEKSSASRLFVDLSGFPAVLLYDDEMCSIYKLVSSDSTVAITASARKDNRGHWMVADIR